MAEGKKVQQGTNSAANYHFFITCKCNLLGSNISGLTWGTHGFSRFEWGVER
jgi:hypothetical protein